LDNRNDLSICDSSWAAAMKSLQRFTWFAIVLLLVSAFASSRSKPSGSLSQSSTNQQSVNQTWIIEGQKRYLTNCGRCHQPPRKFSPREMAMAVRHMRVRAMLTEDDMKYVIYYMTH
jgi:hypothetical protein